MHISVIGQGLFTAANDIWWHWMPKQHSPSKRNHHDVLENHAWYRRQSQRWL